ncbi:hypothetical protein Nepgr_024260 [Nepenthes gracilis]|uniref:PORR domain-containing protein n=1 Tax=Nepenthes gracilis TaxID=150966 RepID=A0AAD3T4B3_NEPGR|nr:hypothetical protein Nepgr_024260 [Nepenthes gracilis]
MLFKIIHTRSKSSYRPHSDSQFFRTFFEEVEIKFVRDRGLDHAVEKEKNLRPMQNLKILIKSEPSKSLPLSIITQKKDDLKIPIRPIEFIRKYPSIFEEFFPGNVRIHPHVRLTQEVLSLDAEEQLIHQSDSFRRGAADRLLKLLMLCRVYEIPLKLVDRLKWDLGLPDNYIETLVPEFPDYFQVKNVMISSTRSGNVRGSNEDLLELVCWNDELSVSVMENRAMKAESAYPQGSPLKFPLHFSKGFDMDEKLKKLIDVWQKLPYISPYENASHLQPKSGISDRWAVAVLHELLHILVPKKIEQDNILSLGEYLGIRSRFKRALVHHPGIFYLSSKTGTYTVVLREAYKRDVLIEKHPLMDMRNRYIHLMNSVKEAQKGQQVKKVERDVGEDDPSGEEREKGIRLSDSEVEDDSDDEDEETDEAESSKVAHETIAPSKGRGAHSRSSKWKKPLRTTKIARRYPNRTSGRR